VVLTCLHFLPGLFPALTHTPSGQPPAFCPSCRVRVTPRCHLLPLFGPPPPQSLVFRSEILFLILMCTGFTAGPDGSSLTVCISVDSQDCLSPESPRFWGSGYHPAPRAYADLRAPRPGPCTPNLPAFSIFFPSAFFRPLSSFPLSFPVFPVFLSFRSPTCMAIYQPFFPCLRAFQPN